MFCRVALRKSDRYHRRITVCSAGLTLIEFLIGIAIFSVIAASLYFVFANGIQLNRRSQATENSFRAGGWLAEIWALDLENMVSYQYSPTSPSAATDNLPPAFNGDASSCSLVLATDQGLRKVRYSLESPQQGHIHTVIVGKKTSKNVPILTRVDTAGERMEFLIRADSPWGALDTDDSLKKVEVLSRQIKAGSLTFSYASRDGEKILWKKEWNDPDFPAAVRMEMVIVDPQGKEEPVTIQRDVLIPLGAWGKGING